MKCLAVSGSRRGGRNLHEVKKHQACMQLAGSRDGEEMWKCESVKIWKYENMEMPSSVVIASSYDAGGKNARQFNRFVD